MLTESKFVIPNFHYNVMSLMSGISCTIIWTVFDDVKINEIPYIGSILELWPIEARSTFDSPREASRPPRWLDLRSREE
jgi:hypothetical protein